MKNFFDLTLPELETSIEALGVKPYRARQLYKWVYKNGVLDLEAMTDLSKVLRLTLRNVFSFDAPTIEEQQESSDGSIKFVLRTHDGHFIESVYMPEKDRGTVCVSSQIGCKMSCAFCVTGKIGFIRNLKTSEIVGQVMAVRPYVGEARISNIVFMGMGEPLDNIPNLFRAIDILEDPHGFDISHRRITVSTVGLLDGLQRLHEKRAQIAISLNAPTSEVRTRLMPINRVYPLQDIVAYVKGLKNMGRIRITFEYILIRNVNDSMQDARRLAELLKGVRCKINLIPYNKSPYTEFESPDQASIDAFQSYLLEHKFTAIVRDSRASDIGGGCGQLGMKYLKAGQRQP